MNLPANIPNDLPDLLHAMATDLSAILRDNFVGLYLWGSLTYDAFDETCSDVDLVAVTQRDLDAREFSELDAWLTNKKQQNRWVARIDMRFVIDHKFLDKASRCCGFYHHTGKLTRHGSDGPGCFCRRVRKLLKIKDGSGKKSRKRVQECGSGWEERR